MRGELELVTPTTADTREVAQVVARALRAGDVVALTGELGAGKTAFVQAAAGALGVTERVTSPTFLLRRDYEGRVPVVHLDVYRLQSLQEVVELGYDDVLDGTRVAFVEWGDAMRPLLPADHLEVELTVAEPGPAAALSESEPRRILVRPHGDDWVRRLGDLADDLAHWTPRGPRQET